MSTSIGDSLEHFQLALRVTIYITSTASSLVSFTVLFYYICAKNVQKIEYFMIAMISVGSLMSSLSLVTAVSINFITPTYCSLQGFFISFGTLLSLAWTSNIAYTMKMSIMKLTPEQTQYRLKIIFILAFTLPLILSSVPLIWSKYTISQQPLSDTICYIGGGRGRDFFVADLMLLLCHQIPLLFTFLFNLQCIYQVISVYKSLTNDAFIIAQITRLLVYPYIFMICQSQFLAYNLMLLFVENPHAYLFIIICYGFSNSNGFFVGVAYGLNTILSGKRQKKIQNSTLTDSGFEVSEIPVKQIQNGPPEFSFEKKISAKSSQSIRSILSGGAASYIENKQIEFEQRNNNQL